jgi:hypothetical protein
VIAALGVTEWAPSLRARVARHMLQEKPYPCFGCCYRTAVRVSRSRVSSRSLFAVFLIAVGGTETAGIWFLTYGYVVNSVTSRVGGWVCLSVLVALLVSLRLLFWWRERAQRWRGEWLQWQRQYRLYMVDRALAAHLLPDLVNIVKAYGGSLDGTFTVELPLI